MKQSKPESYKVVILCGGMGTRMQEETIYRPKPLVEVGGRPVLWHIMKHYSHYGFRDFVLALGYKGEMIADYFENYRRRECDYTITLGDADGTLLHDEMPPDEREWRITFAWTGVETAMGGRIARAGRYIQEDLFLATYGDGVSDVDIRAVLDFHRRAGKCATLTAVPLPSAFGVLGTKADVVTEFREKPVLEGRINGGFFVFNRGFLEYLHSDEVDLDTPLRELVACGELAAYPHDGFWKSMDTYKDVVALNRMWKEGDAPWMKWGDSSVAAAR